MRSLSKTAHNATLEAAQAANAVVLEQDDDVVVATTQGHKPIVVGHPYGSGISRYKGDTMRFISKTTKNATYHHQL